MRKAPRPTRVSRGTTATSLRPLRVSRSPMQTGSWYSISMSVAKVAVYGGPGGSGSMPSSVSRITASRSGEG